jgi:hypothetical protein
MAKGKVIWDTWLSRLAKDHQALGEYEGYHEFFKNKVPEVAHGRYNLASL